MTAPIDAAVSAAAPPKLLPEHSVGAWWSQTLILTGRQVVVAFRDPATLVQVLIFPVLTMIMFKVVLGDIVGKATGQDSAYGTVPLVVLTSAMFGSVVAATRLNLERKTGLLGRLYVLPINRGADFTSRVLGEAVRALLTTIVLVACGFAIGFRFTQGAGAAIGIFAVAVAYAGAFAMLALALAVNASPGAPLVPYLGLLEPDDVLQLRVLARGPVPGLAAADRREPADDARDRPDARTGRRRPDRRRPDQGGRLDRRGDGADDVPGPARLPEGGGGFMNVSLDRRVPGVRSPQKKALTGSDSLVEQHSRVVSCGDSPWRPPAERDNGCGSSHCVGLGRRAVQRAGRWLSRRTDEAWPPADAQTTTRGKG